MEAKRKKTTKAKQVSKQTYSIAQFVEVAESMFKARKTVVETALELAHQEMYTEKEAMKIVSDFMMKEVK